MFYDFYELVTKMRSDSDIIYLIDSQDQEWHGSLIESEDFFSVCSSDLIVLQPQGKNIHYNFKHVAIN